MDIFQTLNYITIGDIEEEKLDEVYNKMKTVREDEISAALSQHKKVLDARIWLTRVEKFYADKKDILALLTMHYIMDIQTYCHNEFGNLHERSDCVYTLLKGRDKKELETRREYSRYKKEREKVIERALEIAKTRLLKEIGWVLNKTIEKELRTDEILDAIDPTKIFKPSAVITAPANRIYLPANFDREAFIQHQRICSNCHFPFSAHITTTNEKIRLCPPVISDGGGGGGGGGGSMGPPFTLPPAAAMRIEKKHSSLFKGGYKKRRRRRKKSRKRRKRI